MYGTASTPRIRPRELRRRVILPARMRTAAGWSDACILNISSRGLQIQASGCAPKGGDVELWRGDQVIVAQVVWRSGAKAGLRAEEQVPVEEILSLSQSPALQLTVGDGVDVERRAGLRAHHDSRLLGRALEFISVAVIAATLSTGMFLMVLEAIAKPLAAARHALGG